MTSLSLFLVRLARALQAPECRLCRRPMQQHELSRGRICGTCRQRHAIRYI